MICKYCGKQDDEMLVIHQVVKPKGHKNRWEKIGYCCFACYENGKPLEYIVVEGMRIPQITAVSGSLTIKKKHGKNCK